MNTSHVGQHSSLGATERGMTEPLLISRQELIRTFGFSATLVAELGPADYIRANKGWGLTYFYDLERVEVFAQEHAQRIERIRDGRPRRQERARAASHRRIQETVEWSRAIPILVAPIPPHALEQARRYFEPQSLTQGRALLFLRLHYTNYLECVCLAARRYGSAEARIVLSERFDAMLNTMIQKGAIIVTTTTATRPTG